jgi:hypothetical protein
LPYLEPVELEVCKVLEQPNRPIMHSYFIERGLASIVAGNSHKRLEVGLIGSEGTTGIPIVSEFKFGVSTFFGCEEKRVQS